MPSLPDLLNNLRDPLKFARFLWPDIVFYNKQKELLYSIAENDETVVVAGNVLGVCPPLMV